MSNSLISRAARPISRRGNSQPHLATRRLRVVVERDVLRDRELEHEAATLPVLGDVTDAHVEHVSRVRVVHGAAVDRDGAALGLAQPGDRLDQLRLAVPVDAGDADDLTRPDVEADTAHLLDAAIVAHVQVSDREDDVAGGRRRLLDAEQHFASDHRLGERGFRRARRGHGLDALAAP